MSLQLTKADILFRQRVLRQAGLYFGKLDGIYGPATMRASEIWDTQYLLHRRAWGEHGSRTESNLRSVLPRLQSVIREFLESILYNLDKLGSDIVVKVLSGTRTYAEQDALYAQGRTTPGDIVTKAKGGRSNHNFALAVDIGIFDNGKYLRGDTPEEIALYDTAADLSRRIPSLARGADWTKPDRPHYELDHGLKIAEVRRRFEKGIPIITNI